MLWKKEVTPYFFLLESSILSYQQQKEQAYRSQSMKNRFETRIHIKKRAPKITTRFITSMTTTFYVTWAAYILTSILTMAGITLSYSVTIISSLLTKSGAVVYPLIYIFFFDEVRDDINKLSYEYCSLF